MAGSNALSARIGRPPLAAAPCAPAPTATAGGEVLSASRLGAEDSSSIESVGAIAASVSPLLLTLSVPEWLRLTPPPHVAATAVGRPQEVPDITRTLW